MKKIILTASLAWLASFSAGFAQTAPPAPQRSIVRVAGDVYRFQDNAHFGLFVVTSQGVILVDPLNLDAANWVKGEIAARLNGAKVVEVIYSHHDWDHAAGAGAFPGAKILSRVETIKDLQPLPVDAKLPAPFIPSDANKDGLIQISEAIGSNKENFSKIDKNGDGGISMREMTLHQNADILAPTETYDTSVKKVTLGGKTVELHYVKALHADDLSFVYFPAEKILFFVDVISLKRLPFMTLPGFEEGDMAAIFDRAMTFDAAYVVGGHGAIGNKQDIADVRQYFADLQQGVQTGIDQGKTVQQIQAELTLDKYKDWDSYAMFRPLNIQGMYDYLKRK